MGRVLWPTTAINYALGAYLARNYGGAELFRKIVQSESSGVDAIESALSDLGHDVSFGELLANWAAATCCRTTPPPPPGTGTTPGRGAPPARPTARVPAGLDQPVQLRVPAVRVAGHPWPDADRLALEGPYLHSLRSFNERTQPPHSNMYTTLGRNTGTVRLSVTANSDNRITVVVKE